MSSISRGYSVDIVFIPIELLFARFRYVINHAIVSNLTDIYTEAIKIPYITTAAYLTESWAAAVLGEISPCVCGFGRFGLFLTNALLEFINKKTSILACLSVAVMKHWPKTTWGAVDLTCHLQSVIQGDQNRDSGQRSWRNTV